MSCLCGNLRARNIFFDQCAAFDKAGQQLKFAKFHDKGQNLWIYFVRVVSFWPQSLGQPRIDFPKQAKQNQLLMRNLQKQIDGIRRSKIFQCSKCPRSFKREIYLQNHMILAHQGLTPFKCIDCKTIFDALRTDLIGCIEEVL